MSLYLGATIEIEKTGVKYHTIDSWGLVVTNNNYILEPEQETAYINIPGRDGFLDASEAISGRRIFKKRQISLELGGIRERMNWDTVISDFRNKIQGKVIHLIFDNDTGYYWKGRAYIKDFDRIRKVGTFILELTQADPYKYEIEQSTEPWKWDPFSFVTGVIRDINDIAVNGSKTVTVPKGFMEVSPTFVVGNIKTSSFTVSNGKVTHNLITGSNRYPDITVNGEEEISLVFTGSATVSIVFRGGSL